MIYRVEVTRISYRPYNAAGEWLDGDREMLAEYGTDVCTYDADDAECFGSPIAWAFDRIERTDARQPSTSPVPKEVPEHAWLTGTYNHPYGSEIEETTIRLTGDWSDRDRAIVFRAITAS
jgi:hypothetical protein